MQIKTEKLPKSQVKIEIELSKEEFDGFLEKAALKISENIEVKGFRKGNVPRKIVEEKIGKENILIEAGDLAVQDSYKKAALQVMDKEDIEPISQPEIKIKKIAAGSPLVFEATAQVLPQIDLPDYRKIASGCRRKKVATEEKEVQGTLEWIRRKRAKFSAKLGPAEKGDFVELEYWSPDIVEISEQNKKKDAFILGEGHFIPGFENLLLDVKPGEEKSNVVLEIPQDHAFKKIAGKKIAFNIKIAGLQKVELPELNDDFARNAGKFEDLESLKNNIREEIEKEKETAENQRLRSEVLTKIAERSKMEIPEILVKRETGQMLENFKKDVPGRLNISFEEYIEKINKTENQIKEMLAEQAEKKVKNFLVLREIGKKENIQVSEEEVKKHPEQQKDYAKEVIRTEKIFQFLENLNPKSKITNHK